MSSNGEDYNMHAWAKSKAERRRLELCFDQDSSVSASFPQRSPLVMPAASAPRSVIRSPCHSWCSWGRAGRGDRRFLFGDRNSRGKRRPGWSAPQPPSR